MLHGKMWITIVKVTVCDAKYCMKNVHDMHETYNTPRMGIGNQSAS